MHKITAQVEIMQTNKIWTNNLKLQIMRATLQ